MLFNKKSEIDDLFDFNGVKMKTFTDVAKAAGVSYATVSRALSGSNQIGKSTRERIVRLCDEMGYTGNYVARSMVMKKTYLLGLVVPAIENEFMSQLAYYVEMSARARGYNIMLCNSEPDLKQEEMVVKLLLGRRVDGILIVPQSPATYEKIAPLLEQIPAVFLSENLRDQPQSYVSVDNSRGAYLGVEYLYGLGHREILYFGRRHTVTHQLRLPELHYPSAPGGGLSAGLPAIRAGTQAPSQRLCPVLHREWISDGQGAVCKAHRLYSDLCLYGLQRTGHPEGG